MNTSKNANIIVVGGGPSGYSAAIRAAQLGAKVILIEKDVLGGTCLNRGCIPTKFFWEILHKKNKTKNIESQDFFSIQLKKNKAVDVLSKGVKRLIESYSISIVEGTAKFLNYSELEVDSKSGNKICFKGEKFVIAAGSKPRNMTSFIIDHNKFINSDDALNLTQIPKSLLVIGGGAIGVEMAVIFSGFGCDVKLVEKEAQILPGESEGLACEVKKALERMGIHVETGVNVFSDLVLSFEKVLIATGRENNMAALDLDSAGIKYNKKGIFVNQYLETNVENIYAAGDITANSQYLAYTAQCEGIIAAENAMGQKNIVDNSIVPKVVFSMPQAASVGLKDKDIDIEKMSVGRFPFAANSRAFIEGERAGWVKVIADKASGVLLGGQIIGQGAEELIALLSLSIRHKLKIHDLKRELFFHPSLSETIYSAVENAAGKCVELPMAVNNLLK